MTQTADHPQPIRSNQDSAPFIGMTKIGVSGFKSFSEETIIQLGGLTVFAGANSSGKSSFMQPFLLMKQTIESDYDPGVFQLNGPNVQFTSGEELLSRKSKRPEEGDFTVVNSVDDIIFRSMFHWERQSGISIAKQSVSGPEIDEIVITPQMKPEEVLRIIQGLNPDFQLAPGGRCQVVRHNCFLQVELKSTDAVTHNYSFWTGFVVGNLRQMIHVQGLRGNPARTYRTSAVSDAYFEGQFENYVASIIDRFQKENPEQLARLQQALQKLGLTDIVQTQRLNDTQIELRVGRVLGSNDATDTVNIADVGFGVSQVLPVIVALLVARPGQLVYIEQPEIHLHPRAQVALAEIFADAANRGVRVVVETHSELFLLGVQALVAEDKLDPNEVKLHWFKQSSDGSSKVTSAELDETGAFGDWPEDFGMTALALENRYLSAAEAKLWKSTNGSNN